MEASLEYELMDFPEEQAGLRHSVKGMTAQDISKAQDLARECVKKNYKDC